MACLSSKTKDQKSHLNLPGSAFPSGRWRTATTLVPFGVVLYMSTCIYTSVSLSRRSLFKRLRLAVSCWCVKALTTQHDDHLLVAQFQYINTKSPEEFDKILASLMLAHSGLSAPNCCFWEIRINSLTQQKWLNPGWNPGHGEPVFLTMLSCNSNWHAKRDFLRVDMFSSSFAKVLFCQFNKTGLPTIIRKTLSKLSTSWEHLSDFCTKRNLTRPKESRHNWVPQQIVLHWPEPSNDNVTKIDGICCSHSFGRGDCWRSEGLVCFFDAWFFTSRCSLFSQNAQVLSTSDNNGLDPRMYLKHAGTEWPFLDGSAATAPGIPEQEVSQSKHLKHVPNFHSFVDGSHYFIPAFLLATEMGGSFPVWR